MANHKSAQKRIRSSATRKDRNHYQAKTTRNAIKQLRNTTSKTEAGKLYNEVASMLDKLAKKNVIHKNKAANLKSGLSRHVAALK
jgi:small subunit ribosomal protein S20